MRKATNLRVRFQRRHTQIEPTIWENYYWFGKSLRVLFGVPNFCVGFEWTERTLAISSVLVWGLLHEFFSLCGHPLGFVWISSRLPFQVA